MELFHPGQAAQVLQVRPVGLRRNWHDPENSEHPSGQLARLSSMVEVPENRYARAPDGVSLAYQVIGDGPLDLVFLSGLAVPGELMWEDAAFVRFAKRLAGFSRTIFYDPRGIGPSGGDFRDNTEEEIADGDLTAVLDAVGIESAVLVGTFHAGPTVIRYAVRHAERAASLVIIDSFAHYIPEEGYPWGISLEILDEAAASARDTWGTGHVLEWLAPSRWGDDAFRAWWARCQRLGAPPEQIVGVLRASWLRDVRQLLPDVAVPTLILHRGKNRFIRAGAGRYLAENIPGAKYVELAGDDQLYFVGDTDRLLDEMEEFLTGASHGPEARRVLLTVLFTDIVGSTQRAAELGDRKWRDLLDAHDQTVRRQLGRFNGREVDNAGDGFLATFDGPRRAIECACAIRDAVRAMGIEVRAGLHTGEIELRGDDVAGMAVHIGARVAASAGPGEVLVSGAVPPLVAGSGLEFEDRGERELKGVPGSWKLFAVRS
ncbi:MAG TPA: adenylate/guanylate cyclase domain-containing protein [Acidimicrobiales bacterium]|nr:adenylate/guanylate cyclase domain-containing protein [Acidimicrobiales bacterium]